MMIPTGITDPEKATDDEIVAAAIADGDSREEAEALLAAIRGELGEPVD